MTLSLDANSSSMTASIRSILEKIVRNCEYSRQVDQSDVHAFRQAICAFGHMTSANRDATERVEYGLLDDATESTPRYGLRLKSSGIALANIMNHLDEMPEEVRASFPEVTDDDWYACVRIAVMLLLSFDVRFHESEAMQ